MPLAGSSPTKPACQQARRAHRPTGGQRRLRNPPRSMTWNQPPRSRHAYLRQLPAAPRLLAGSSSPKPAGRQARRAHRPTVHVRRPRNQPRSATGNPPPRSRPAPLRRLPAAPKPLAGSSPPKARGPAGATRPPAGGSTAAEEPAAECDWEPAAPVTTRLPPPAPRGAEAARRVIPHKARGPAGATRPPAHGGSTAAEEPAAECDWEPAAEHYWSYWNHIVQRPT
jgi:hypothetical protein